MHRTPRRLVRLVPFGIAAVAFVVIGGVVVRFLWNWLLPPLFNVPAVTFSQALGLLALCRILFGGLGRFGGRPFGPRMGPWSHMSPDEQTRLRQRLRERWGTEPTTDRESPVV
jgi:hypothetical protein